MSERLNILVALASEVVFDQIEPFISRSNVEVTRVHSGQHALTLSQGSPYDLIVVQSPLPDLDFSEFFKTIRAPESASGQSPMLILTRDDRLDSVAAYLDGELAQACCIDAAPEQIRMALTELVGVAMRAKARLGVELSARLDQGPIQIFCQTVNVSEAGLLIRHQRPLPLTTKVRLTLSLPDESEPIEAIGEVVRHAVPGVEAVEGMAVRLLRIAEDGRLRLADFVARHEQELLH
jgi:DNA-binding response OmpR family regulator